jgi:hypothetical protein
LLNSSGTKERPKQLIILDAMLLVKKIKLSNMMFLEHKGAVTTMIHGSLSPQHGVASGCRWRRKPPDMVASSQYIEKAVAGSRRGVVLQLAYWTRCLQLLTTRP